MIPTFDQILALPAPTDAEIAQFQADNSIARDIAWAVRNLKTPLPVDLWADAA